MWIDRTCTAEQLTQRFDDLGIPADPVALLDLDSIDDWSNPDLLQALVPFSGRRVLLGIATRDLPDAADDILARLTCTLTTDGSRTPSRSSAWVSTGAPIALGEAMAHRARRVPRATSTLDHLLRLTAAAPVEDAVAAESAAYSMLLCGPEFSRWAGNRAGPRHVNRSPNPIAVRRDDDVLHIRLDEPQRRNAFSAGLRDGLVDALQLVALDPSITRVELTGAGPAFSSGGDLDEFGSNRDPSAAHPLRLARSAGLAVHRVADRVRAHLHGPCLGAGVEVPLFAGQVVATPGTTWCLPELEMGLVPGAGGTVSVVRRIGRWRTAYLLLSGEAVNVETALTWGLADELE